MAIENISTKTDAYQVHKEAKVNKAKLDKGNQPVEKIDQARIQNRIHHDRSAAELPADGGQG